MESLAVLKIVGVGATVVSIIAEEVIKITTKKETEDYIAKEVAKQISKIAIKSGKGS